MVLAGKLSIELGIRSSADKFFKFWVTQLHNVQNITDRVHETKLHQGDDWHDIGSIKTWTFTIDGKVETCKESIEAIDEENKIITFALSDGEFGKNYKFCKVHVQIIDKVDGGGVAKYTFEYEKLNEDVEPPYRYLEYFNVVNKDVDAHALKA